MTGAKHTVYDGKIVQLNLETASLPDGREAELEIVRHPGGAVIAAIDTNNRVCMIRQYRYAIDRWIWELPAGLLEAGEAPEKSARRELLEETGLSAGNWRSLGNMLSSPGFCDEYLHLFMATGLQQGETRHEENEFIEVHWLSLDEAVGMALSGEIDDAKTVAGLLRAAFILGKKDEAG